MIFGPKKFTLKFGKVKFLTSLPQIVLHVIKKSFEGTIWMEKTIEIHLPRYEIAQPSPHYWTAKYIKE